MFKGFERETYGFCVVVKDDAPDKKVRYEHSGVHFGALDEMFVRWPRNNFDSDASSFRGDKRGWDPIGTFVYDSIWTLQHANKYPAPVLFRADFYSGIIVTVTTAVKRGEDPWKACAFHPDCMPWTPNSGPLKAELDIRENAWGRLQVTFQEFLKTGGGAGAYAELESAMLHFQEAHENLREAREKEQRRQLKAAAKAKLEEARRELEDLDDED